jgi:hypothetical protein
MDLFHSSAKFNKKAKPGIIKYVCRQVPEIKTNIVLISGCTLYQDQIFAHEKNTAATYMPFESTTHGTYCRL